MNYVFNVSDFKEYYVRDFPFQPSTEPVDMAKYIQDSDINMAHMKSKAFFNKPCLCGYDDIDVYKSGLFALVAHLLCLQLKASQKGINGSYEWAYSSKSVGSVSASSAIPSWVSENPNLSYLSTTDYGMEYLMMILPCMVGNFGVVEGATLP